MKLRKYKLNPATLLGARNGSVALIFALAIVPIVGILGVAVDYSRYSDMRVNMQNAADSAVLAAAKAETKELATLEMSKIAGAYNLDSQGLKGLNVSLVDYKKGSAEVKISGAFDATFTKILGIYSKPLEVRAATNKNSSTRAMSSKHATVYIAVDKSGSMLLAANEAERIKLEAATKSVTQAVYPMLNGCQFACHQAMWWTPVKFYTVAKSNGILLREDILNPAVETLINEVIDSGAGRRRVSTIGFSAEAKMLIGPTTSKSAAISSLSLFPEEKQTDTFFEVVMPQIKGMVGRQGAGDSADEPDKILVLVTDGLRSSTNSTLPPPLGEHVPIETHLCTSIKSTGIKLAVMDIAYRKSPENAIFNERVASVYNDISPKLKECASDGMYFYVPFGDSMKGQFQALATKIINEQAGGVLRLTK